MRRMRSSLLGTVLIMAIGGALALFTFELLPNTAKDFVESGQARVSEWKSEIVDNQPSDYLGRVALETICSDAAEWGVRKAPDGNRYWSCERQKDTAFFGASKDFEGQYGPTVCTTEMRSDWSVQLASGEQVEQQIGITRCERGIDPEAAISLVREYFDKLNNGDEAGLRKILTPEIFVETRTILLSFRDIEFEIQVLDIEAPSTCLDTCDVSAKVIASGNTLAPGAIWFSLSGGFEEGTSVFSIGQLDGDTLITGID